MDKSLKQLLKEEAKNQKTTMGVLCITNTLNQKILIQGALNLESLVNRIKFSLNAGQFTNAGLQSDWKQYGEQAFTFEFIYIVPRNDDFFVNYKLEILNAEKLAIKEYGSGSNLYS